MEELGLPPGPAAVWSEIPDVCTPLSHFQQVCVCVHARVCVLTYQGPGTVLSAGQKQSKSQAQEDDSVACVLFCPQSFPRPRLSPDMGNQLRWLRAVSGPWLWGLVSKVSPQVGFIPATSSGGDMSMERGAGPTGPGCTCPSAACQSLITPNKLQVGRASASGRGGGSGAWCPAWKPHPNSA